jgi:hypothetical protein
MVFVAWNKVITVQYFHWYLCLLPLALVQSEMSRYFWLGSFLVWLVAEVSSSSYLGVACFCQLILVCFQLYGMQLHWNFWAFHLELRGQSVFFEVWAAGLIFLAVNLWVIISVINNHRFMPVMREPAPREIPALGVSRKARSKSASARAKVAKAETFHDRIQPFPIEWWNTQAAEALRKQLD